MVPTYRHPGKPGKKQSGGKRPHSISQENIAQAKKKGAL
jgi:hypothetical protein